MQTIRRQIASELRKGAVQGVKLSAKGSVTSTNLQTSLTNEIVWIILPVCPNRMTCPNALIVTQNL